MLKRFTKFITKSRYAVMGAVFALALATAGTIAFIQPDSSTPTASAASCDKVNIVYCGFKGSTTAAKIASFKSFYNKGSDGRYNDLKSAYNWSGASAAKMNGMNTSNTKMGTMYRNGDIKVDGKVVGHDAWVSARFGAGQKGFSHVEGNVYARKTTTSLAEASTPVLVHFNAAGDADFAAMVTCGNAVKFTPVVKPKPALACQNLTFSAVKGEDRTYSFTATGSAKNTQITSYVFHFGDNSNATKNTGANKASVNHKYAKAGASYSAYVVVNAKAINGGVTSNKCHVTVKTPKPPVKTTPKASLTCEGLTSSIVPDKDNTYNFTAKASASNTTITSYVFDFGDNSGNQTVTTSAKTAGASHTYQGADQSFTAKVSVNSKDVKGVTSKKCEVIIKTPKTPSSPQLICEELSFSAVADQSNTYSFVASASAKDTTITSYDFSFGDNSDDQNVATSAETASTSHSYADADQDYTATVKVNSADQSGVTSQTCQVTIPKQQECKPGVPVGSEKCNECKPGVPVGSEECQPPVTPPTPPELPNTGAGNVIGFFGATTVAGGLLHRFFLRRKYAN